MPAPDKIYQLVERFNAHRESYLSGLYKEARLRMDFLDPFFEALGWDVNNKSNLPEDSRDVIIEDAQVAGERRGAPDYAFRVGRERKFYVEAKKPAANIEYGAGYASQLRTYSWNSKLPLGILTDFEEFAVYDTRNIPRTSDHAATGRVKLLHYADYLPQWDEIAGIFSREAVLQGSFDQYARKARSGKGSIEVDDAFLKDIEGWREMLARNLALRNPGLDVPQMNYAVQMTIDRIIFLRICEDRGIEPQNQLKDLLDGAEVYARLCRIFKDADTRYNSGLFNFTHEKGEASQADDLSLRMLVDDRSLKEIIRGLYHPAPYLFEVIPADILGQVYERFLGKVIRLTAGHQAKVEEKPEVRKAGGVYYTPTYIVDYIVKNTVGKLLEGEAANPQKGRDVSHPYAPPAEVMTPREAAKLKIVDPACGSGSFLLGAYQYLLDWHVKWYTEHEPEKWAKGKDPTIYQAPGGWRLTTAEKKRILLNNIHGVDIDAQAVEVTKLSLSLKVLEGESQETIGTQMRLFKERALPDLGRNIQCGNSLIGSDYYEGKMFVDPEEKRRVNAFDWQTSFPQVFAQGGFDAVIGNPPYIRMEAFKELKEYLKLNYSCHDERSDMYAYFIEKTHKIMKHCGRFGMIVSNKFLRANYGKPLRNFLLNNVSINQIVDFAGLPVFKGATVRTLIFLSSNERQKDTLLYTPPIDMENFSSVEAGINSVEKAISEVTYGIAKTTLLKDIWSFSKQDADELINRIKNNSLSLAEYCDYLICRGVVSGLTEAFVIDMETRTKILNKNPKAENIIKPFLNGRDIRRYSLEPKRIFLLYTYHGINISNYPSVENYLRPFKEKLKRRATKQEWYELQQPQFAYMDYFQSTKIVFPDIAVTPRFVLDRHGYYGSNTMYFIPKDDPYLLGLLNSKFAYFYFRTVCAGLEGKNTTYLRFFGQYLEKFPVVIGEKILQHRMVTLVERMLELHKLTGKIPQEKERIQREIEATDRQIDALVYQLYDLTEEEIRIVEGK